MERNGLNISWSPVEYFRSWTWIILNNLNQIAGQCFNGGCCCPSGWTGQFCTQRVCPVAGTFGPNCDCQNLNSCEAGHSSCNPETGAKICIPSWTGDNCQHRYTLLPYFHHSDRALFILSIIPGGLFCVIFLVACQDETTNYHLVGIG